MTSGNTGPQRSRYARMDCPVLGCVSGPGATRLNGTIPGVKRHTMRVHGIVLYRQVVWPPLYPEATSAVGDMIRSRKSQPPKPYAEMNVKELRAACKRRGIPQRDKNKPDLIAALTEGGSQ